MCSASPIAVARAWQQEHGCCHLTSCFLAITWHCLGKEDTDGARQGLMGRWWQEGQAQDTSVKPCSQQLAWRRLQPQPAPHVNPHKPQGTVLKHATPLDNNENGYSDNGYGKMDIELDNCHQPWPSVSQLPAHQTGASLVAPAPTRTWALHTRHGPSTQVPITTAILPSLNPCS